MKKILLSVALLATYSQIMAQSGNTQLTLKPGSCASCVAVYVKPDFTDANLKFSNFAFTISVENTGLPNPTPSIVNNNLNNMPFGVDNTFVDPAVGGRVYYDIHADNSNPGATTGMSVTSGTEFLAFEIAFSDGIGVSQIQMNDLTNGSATIPPSGPYSASNIYVSQIGPGWDGSGILTPIGSGFFYSSPGMSTAASSGTDEYVTTDIAIPLPIIISAFNAQSVNNSKTLLTWDVEQEQGVQSFEIQHGTDGIHFDRTVGIITANGSRAYQMTDNTPSAGENYYRLKAKNKDGKESYMLRKVWFDAIDRIVVKPTLTSDIVTITLPERYQDARIEVVNAVGQKVAVKVEGSTAYRTVSLAGLASGTYVLRVLSGNNLESYKVQLTN